MGAYQKNGRAVMQLVPGSTRDDFTTTDESGGSSPCDTTDFWHEWIQSFSKVGSGPDGEVDPLTAFVSLSRREQRAGKLIVTVSNTTFAPRGTSLTVDPNCDASPATCRQTFEWAGHVTFTKTKSPGAR